MLSRRVYGAVVLLSVGFAFGLAACEMAEDASISVAGTSGVVTDLDVDDLHSIAWTDGGMYAVVAGELDDQVARFDWRDGSVQVIDLPGVSVSCAPLRYRTLMVSGAGSLAAVQSCIRYESGQFVSRLVEIDPVSATVTPMFSSSWQRMDLQSFGLPADGSWAVAGEGSRICNSLVRFSGSSVERPVVDPSDLVPRQGESQAEVEAGYGDCSSMGIAEQPTVNGAGDLSFASYPDAAGISGIDRFDARGNVYLVKADNTQAQSLIEDVGEVRLMYSPDGASVAISGSVGDDDGTFVLTVADGSIVKVSDLVGEALSWSPKGDALAVLDLQDDTSRFIILDVAKALASTLSP